MTGKEDDVADEARNNSLSAESSSELSRRDFVTMVAAGLAVGTASASAAAVPVVETDVDVKSDDGVCDAVFIHPATGSHPGVLIWPDLDSRHYSWDSWSR